MHIILYQPDIPQNFGSVCRLAACMGTALHVIEPCGFLLDDKRVKRSVMDYAAQLTLIRHASWEAFMEYKSEHYPNSRLLLLTTKGVKSLPEFSFDANDMLLFGSESSGVPEAVHQSADARLFIPMQPHCRSLNLAMSVAMTLGEGLRQTGQFPSHKDAA